MKTIDNLPGYFGIGIFNPKHEENIGTLWRHAYLYNASFIFIIGGSYRNQSSDTAKSINHIPLYKYKSYDEFKINIPHGCRVVAVELEENSIKLHLFDHPLSCIYILGSENFGLPKYILDECYKTIQIYSPKSQSMNVSVAGTLVMHDRTIKKLK